MPVTLALKTSQYIDPDANKIVSGLPTLRTDYEARDEDIGFLRKFFRGQDTQTLMKIFRKLYMVECRRLTPLTRAVVAIAAKVYGNIRTSSHNALVCELLQIMSKPHFQALLYSHDKIASHDFGPFLTPETDLYKEEDKGTVKVVQFIKSNEPLGATLQYNDETGALEIARILHGGAADRSGLLHVGDEVLEVEGRSVTGKTPDEVVEMLTRMTGSISLKLVSGANKLVPLRECKMRVRAFFDYNPISDALNPCPEAGLAFCRGDVLHIVSQEDPWWWQARKEGEITGRAGLIPARQLQERTEMLRRAHSDEDISNCGGRGSRHTSPCRISPKTPRSRRIRKTMYQAQQSGGTPKHLSREYDMDDIPTYEEVELFQPTSGRFRPVVLIGPPAVGRNELKRRLMAYAPNRFEEVVPYTSRARKPHEQDGRDYHFVPREEMERGIINHRFVEFGEFRGNLYGTSFASIRAVITSGKICLLSPHSQAIKFLRSVEIKPFIIYIRPPPLEVLRATRRASRAMKTLEGGNTRLFTEEDLTDMLSIGARIEEKYGHLFDAVIINDNVVEASKELLAIVDQLETRPQDVTLMSKEAKEAFMRAKQNYRLYRDRRERIMAM